MKILYMQRITLTMHGYVQTLIILHFIANYLCFMFYILYFMEEETLIKYWIESSKLSLWRNRSQGQRPDKEIALIKQTNKKFI